jgi:diketogulonate reductase-like aldo/keto reductase
MYGNEEEVGRALRESGLARKDVYITTKYSGLHGLDIETSIHNSLKMVCALNSLTLTSTADDGNRKC